MDRDTRAVTELLDTALAKSGMSQNAFAAALGTSPSRLSTYRSGKTKPTAQFFVRAQRIADAISRAHSSRLMTSIDTAVAIRQSDDDTWAWKMLIQGRDHLRLMLAHREDLVASWEAAPPSTGSLGLDTLLAALAAREFEAAEEESPEWSKVQPLSEAWIPEHPFLDSERITRSTPDYLAELNVFVPERDLVTA